MQIEVMEPMLPALRFGGYLHIVSVFLSQVTISFGHAEYRFSLKGIG